MTDVVLDGGAVAVVLLLVSVWIVIAGSFMAVLEAPVFWLLKLAVRQAERFEASLLAGGPYHVRPPLRWLVHGREWVRDADILASALQGVRDLRVQYLREQRERIDQLMTRMQQFRQRHGRWPEPGELAHGDRDTRNDIEQG